MAIYSENKFKAILYVIACVILWSFIPIVSRFGQQDLDNYQFLFWSSLLSFAVLFLSTCLMGKFKYFKNYNRKDLTVVFGLGFLGSFLYYLLLYYGYAHMQGIKVVVIQYTWPIFIVIFSFLFLKERITWRNILAIVLGFLGVFVVLTKGNFDLQLNSFMTDLVVLFAAAIFGLFSVLSKKVNFEPFSAATYFFLSATLFSFLAMLNFSYFTVPLKNSLTSIAINGILINGFSYVLWLKGLSYAKASFIAPFVFLTPILATILIIFFFHEIFLPIYAVGLLLVVLAGLISR